MPAPAGRALHIAPRFDWKFSPGAANRTGRDPDTAPTTLLCPPDPVARPASSLWPQCFGKAAASVRGQPTGRNWRSGRTRQACHRIHSLPPRRTHEPQRPQPTLSPFRLTLRPPIPRIHRTASKTICACAKASASPDPTHPNVTGDRRDCRRSGNGSLLPKPAIQEGDGSFA